MALDVQTVKKKHIEVAWQEGNNREDAQFVNIDIRPLLKHVTEKEARET